jgi:hypothetical protein
MNKNFLIGTALVLGLFLSSCSAQAEIPTETGTPAETEVEATPTPSVESGECLACHTDKQRLIDTAKPEEADHEAESKGVG